MKKTLVLCITALLMAGCGTLNAFRSLKPDFQDLPEEALRAAAAQIERAVAEGKRDLVLEDKDGLKLNTPEIVQAVRTRAVRAELTGKLLDTGFAIEQANGRIAILRSSAYKQATTRQERDRNALLVMNENSNRWAIYEGIIESSGLAPKSLAAIERVFFDARKDCMRSGQKFESDSGETQTK